MTWENGAPGNDGVIAALRQRLLEWLVDTSDVIPSKRHPRMKPALMEQIGLG